MSTLRNDERGTVARAWLPEVVANSVVPIASMVHAGTLPQLALAGPVISAISQGSNSKRAAAALRDIGSIIEALVALLVLDVRVPSSNAAVHDAIRVLTPVCLDAVEDMLAESVSVIHLVEVERMWRVGILESDWELHLERATDPRGRPVATIFAPFRKAFGEA